ncbi:hypothetical protein RB213_002865 [Colletotrichum asianum]
MESITRQKPLFPGLSILDVPNDIFLCIFDSLDLHDLFILSQTHPRFRNLIKKSVSEWIADVCSLPSNDRLRFWTGLGYTLPDHYVCEGCCRLHRHGIPHQDLGSVFQPQNSGTRHERPTYNPNMIFRGKIDPHVYRHADIQIALKCHMRGLFENQLYKRVMELRRDRFQPGYLYTGNLWSWKSIPKIVSGRFLIAREVKIDAGVGGRVALNISPICPHEHAYFDRTHSSLFTGQPVSLASIQLPPPFAPPPPAPTLNTTASFQRAAESAQFHPGSESVGSCDRCPIDFAVTFEGNMYCIRVWCDYGPYGTPMDLSWRVHVFCETNHDTRGPTLYHDPGSVRRMYERGY